MSTLTKDYLLTRGQFVMATFCEKNSLPVPNVQHHDRIEFGTCAYYRANVVHLSLAQCSAIGTAGRQWSFPGYTVDRTPYGVVQHELGHHVDVLKSTAKRAYFGDFSIALRGQSGEKEISSYCPNDAEWFAEMFRVYVTNPDLLRLLRPRTHRELASQFEPVFNDTWRDRLAEAPERTVKAAERKIEALAGGVADLV